MNAGYGTPRGPVAQPAIATSITTAAIARSSDDAARFISAITSPSVQL
jgi:hypothetical protein